MRLALATTFLLLLVIGGTYFLFFPQHLQSFASRIVETGITSKNEWLKSFVRSKSYIFNVHAVGAIAYIMAVLLAFALYKGR